MNEKYQKYIASRDWGILKNLVMRRAQGICEYCYLRAATAIHHVTYARIYNERLDDLRAICEECHLHEHGLDASVDRFEACPRCDRPGEITGFNNRVDCMCALCCEELEQERCPA